MAIKHRIINGECLKKLVAFDSNSIDALCTDPPAGIGFMNKKWDSNKGGRDQWILWLTEIMEECYRVMKPGAHGFVWAIPRTSHWTATALENAGFEIRDIITHLFGSGFPKSLNISKAIDKEAGAEREVTKKGERKVGLPGVMDTKDSSLRERRDTPTTKAAKQWNGYGTALKPASEHWILIRKPCSEKTVAKNVLKWGVGGINIDGCRIGTEIISTHGGGDKMSGMKGKGNSGVGNYQTHQGRFPANLILDDVAGEMLDEQSGDCKTGNIKKGTLQGFGKGRNTYGEGCVPREYQTDIAGGASRFFYCAKPSKRERNQGLELEKEFVDDGRKKKIDNPYLRGKTARINTHPTVKAISLMRYLVRMITPPKGIILDPFAGSGTTGCAAIEEGFNFIGIELDKKDCQIARSRMQYSRKKDS